jgi:hypothetical protein
LLCFWTMQLWKVFNKPPLTVVLLSEVSPSILLCLGSLFWKIKTHIEVSKMKLPWYNFPKLEECVEHALKETSKFIFTSETGFKCLPHRGKWQLVKTNHKAIKVTEWWQGHKYVNLCTGENLRTTKTGS